MVALNRKSRLDPRRAQVTLAHEACCTTSAFVWDWIYFRLGQR